MATLTLNYDYKKPEDVYRILVIGDSVAQGQGVKINQNFSNLLENKLNGETSKKKYEVITLAVTGYSTSQELILLEDEAGKYSPDLIIWSYVLNDPAHPVFHDANGELGRYFYSPKIHLIDFIKRKMFFINQKQKAKGCKGEYHELMHCVYRDQVKSNIETIGDYSRDKEISIIFLIHPNFKKNKLFSNYSLISIH